MTHREWVEWIEYFNRNGRLDPIRRYDWGLAQIASILSKVHGGPGELSEFLPYKPKERNVLSNLDDLVKVFGGVKNGRTR